MNFDIAPASGAKTHHLGPPPDPGTQAHLAASAAPSAHPAADPARPATSAANAAAPSAAPAPADDTHAAPAPSSATPQTPDGRSTTFQAVEGGTETRSGETLLVSAYSVLWVILMGWLVLMWRKQATVNARLEDLERAIDRAAAKADKAGKG